MKNKYEQGTFELRKTIVQTIESFYIENLREEFFDAPPQRAFAKSLGLSRSALQWHLKWLKDNSIVENKRYPKIKPVQGWQRKLHEIINCLEDGHTNSQIPT